MVLLSHEQEISNLNQEQLQHPHGLEVLDFDQDDLQHSLQPQQEEQEKYQQAETLVLAPPRNDQEEAAPTISTIPQFQEFNCSSATTKCHHQTQPRNPMKRPIPSSLLDQQMAKKLQLHESLGNYHSLHGFTKLALPMQQNQPPVTPLLPTASAPAYTFSNSNYIEANANADAKNNANSPVSPEQVGVNPTTPSPVKGSPCWVSRRGVDSGSVKPPLPPTIRRTVSDPSPLSGGGTGVDASPLSKRLRMMKHDLELMSNWCDQVISGEEEETEGVNAEKNHLREDHETENETQEAVSVEAMRDSLSLHFNCPCGKRYEILLAGKNCYYRLI